MTTKFEGTKGPWKVKGSLFGEWSISSEYSLNGVKLKNGLQHVANSPSASSKANPEYWKMFFANARLIATAPELLEALQDLVEDITDRFDMESSSTNPGMKTVVKNAQKVIDKALDSKFFSEKWS